MEKPKKKLVFFNPDEKQSDFAFWQSKSYEERLNALEKLRTQYLTSQDGIRPRLQRILSVTRSK